MTGQFPVKSEATPAVSAESRDRQTPWNRRPFKKEIVCWNCKKKGHRQAECKEAASQSPHNFPRSAPVKESRRGPFRVANVYLEASIKGRPFRCLLDTGSDFTLAPYDLIEKNRCKLSKSPVERIKTANDSDIIIAGEATLPLHVVGHRIDTKVLVSKDLSETILGIDWLQAHDCEWDFVHSRVRFKAIRFLW